MKGLLNRISKEGFVVDIKDGKLKVYATKESFDRSIVDEIKKNETAILNHLKALKGLSISKKTYQEIPKSQLQINYPVSGPQVSIWLACQSEKGSSAYNIPNVILLKGAYNITNFQKSFLEVINRHEILRTIFKLDNEGDVKQYIIPKDKVAFTIDFHDLRAFSNKDEIQSEYISNNSVLPFKLDEGPLLRVAIFQIENEEYVLYFNIHHIIADAWSVSIISEEIMDFYEIFSQQKELQIPPLSIQYKDYTIWQLNQLKSETYANYKNYWKSIFEEKPKRIDFPALKNRPKVKTYKGKSISSSISPEIANTLRKLTTNYNGSLFSGLLAIWKVLIYRYTGIDDITIGNPTIGRNHPDLERQIGCYLNLLPIRNSIDPNDTFIEFYNKVKTSLLEAEKNKSYPFEKIVEDLQLQRESNRNPLFDILVDYHGISEATSNKTSAVKVIKEGAIKFDLELHLLEVKENIDFSIRFNLDIYDISLIEGIIDHYIYLVKEFSIMPESKVGEIQLLSNNDTILKWENAKKSIYPETKTFIDLFQEQVNKTPNAIAVDYKIKQLTYSELNTLSNQLANCLVKNNNVKKSDFVGVYLDRSEQYIISILAILKLGAIYVPIDTSYPSKRKEYIINDADINLLITDTTYVLDIDFFEGNIFSIDVEFDANQYDTSYKNEIKNNDLAYVIYTSGTTGNPKGVKIAHESLMNYLKWSKENYLNNNLSNFNFGWFSSPSFDLTITSLFLPIISGGTLKIFDERQDILTILKEYMKTDISCIKLTPSHINLLSQDVITECNIELVIIGGEVLKKSHVEVLKNVNPKLKIYNEYGPTEATVGCITHELADSDASIFIGKPIDNTTVLILDAQKNRVPVGVTGEIYLGGKSLSKGYINSSQTTEEKFIINPFNSKEKLYKTGDLGRWLPNGCIDYIGRFDKQVKIRGYRVELKEIEAVFNRIKDIEEVIVTTHLDTSETNQLITYIKLNEGIALNVGKLKEELFKTLPDYMIPKIFIEIKDIPLTINGKIDYQLLPLPNTLSEQKEYEAPSNELEIKLASIWEEVLGVKKIGVHDNFFEIGGHSLLAIKLSFDIYKEYGMKIEINTIFKYPTIKLQSQYLDVMNTNKNIEDVDNDEVVYL